MKSIPLNLDDEFVAGIDALANKFFVTRSHVLRRLLELGFEQVSNDAKLIGDPPAKGRKIPELSLRETKLVTEFLRSLDPEELHQARKKYIHNLTEYMYHRFKSEANRGLVADFTNRGDLVFKVPTSKVALEVEEVVTDNFYGFGFKSYGQFPHGLAEGFSERHQVPFVEGAAEVSPERDSAVDLLEAILVRLRSLNTARLKEWGRHGH